MLLYRNRTRYNAIVTVKIESTDKPEAAFKLGTDNLLQEIEGKPGVEDLEIAPGKELHLTNNTVATILSSRNSP